MAKDAIRFICSLAEMINADPDVSPYIKVVFLADYRVSLAELIVPAADVSEQISTAGKEASGTGNMKMMINGALTIGTLDGANVEIKKRVGDDNIYIFGLTSVEAGKLYSDGGYISRFIYESDKDLAAAVDMLIDGSLQPDRPRLFSDIYNSLLYNEAGLSDSYFVFRDFSSYAKTQRKLEKDFTQSAIWRNKAIKNVAAAGYFTSDRAVGEYNRHIWRLR
jgi:starch phosphorylase